MKKMSAVLVAIAATFPVASFAAPPSAQPADAPIVIRSAPMRLQPMIISGNVGPSVPDSDPVDDATDSGKGSGNDDDRASESRHPRHAERRHADSRHRRSNRMVAGNNGHVANQGRAKLPEFSSTPIRSWVSRGLEDLRSSPSDDARVVYTAIDGEALDVVGRVSSSDWYAISRETGIAFVKISPPPPVVDTHAAAAPVSEVAAPASNTDSADQFAQPGIGTQAPESSGCLVSLGGSGKTT